MGSKRKTTKLELGILALLVAAFAHVACGRTTQEDSGETHFLSYCSTDCGADYECLCGVCTKSCTGAGECTSAATSAICTTAAAACGQSMVCEVECSTQADCAPLGEDHRCDAGVCRAGTPPDPDAGLVCGTGCIPVTGYPEDTARGCADLTASAVVACQCGERSPMSVCRRRVADGTLWIVPDGQFEDPSAWADCSPAESGRFPASCDFAECALPPSSYCTQQETCAQRLCGGLQYDGSGCAKQSCTKDDECPGNERCVPASVDTSYCSYAADGGCGCAGLTIDVQGAFCNPESEVGPRGTWELLTVDQGAGPCPAEEICQWTWSVSPDGSVVTMKQGVMATAQLTEAELEELRWLIDGPELRLGLRDGFACDPPPTDVGVSMSLTLSGATLNQDVTGCTTTGPAGNAAGQVFTILRAY